MKYTIYKITNKINNKIYIGKHQTHDLNDSYAGSGKLLRRAQRKHGIENFSKKILHVFDTEEEMNFKEAELVTAEFCLREDTYNMCVGGMGGFGYINSNGLNLYGNNGYTDNVKDDLNRGRDTQKYLSENDPEWKQRKILKISQALKGRVGTFKDKEHTEETKRKIGAKNSIAQSGSRNSQYGKPRSEETKEKIRLSLLNRKKK